VILSEMRGKKESFCTIRIPQTSLNTVSS